MPIKNINGFIGNYVCCLLNIPDDFTQIAQMLNFKISKNSYGFHYPGIVGKIIRVHFPDFCPYPFINVLEIGKFMC